MRAILIDPGAETVAEVEWDGSLQGIYRLIGASTIDAVGVGDKDAPRVIYVDGEGFLHEPKPLFQWAGYAQPLAGKGLLLDYDEHGNETASTLPISSVWAMVRFRSDLEFVDIEYGGGGEEVEVLGMPGFVSHWQRPRFREKPPEAAPWLVLGDMEVVGGPPPAKLLKALAVIADRLHPTFDEAGWLRPGKSRESCILASSTVREFLFRIGFRTADFRSVCAVVSANRPDGELIHSLAIGNPENPPGENNVMKDGIPRWDGHAVVVVDGWLIETTMYQAIRPAWAHLKGMAAIPLNREEMRPMWNLSILAGAGSVDEDGNVYNVVWLNQPHNTGWQRSPDFLRKHERERIVDRLVAAFGKWHDEPQDAKTGD